MGRYSRLQEFVRRGEGRAVVEVTLSNTGEDAFRPEVYGRTITFRRTILATGVATVQLLDEAGEVVRQPGREGEAVRLARREGAAALEHLHIHLGNPVTVLHQDEARAGLVLQAADLLYRFFQVSYCKSTVIPRPQRATLLEQLMADLGAGRLEVERTRRALTSGRAAARELGRQVRPQHIMLNWL